MFLTPSVIHATEYQYPLKFAGDAKNRHLVDQQGIPWFMNGEAAWSLIIQLNSNDTTIYLNDRHSKGYNLLMVNLIDHKFASHPPSNAQYQNPFSGLGNNQFPTSFPDSDVGYNEQYFLYADWVIQEAAKRGMIVLLNPAYIGYQCNDDGWCNILKNSSDASINNYGKYLAQRYKDDPNIIWQIGGDEDATAYGVAGKLRKLVEGLKSGGDTHLISTHNSDEQAGLDSWKPTDTWIDINNVYTYFDAYPMANKQFERTDFKPYFLLETYYENDSNHKSLSDIRAQSYWTILSGGILGHIFGNCQIWNYSTGYLGNCTEDWHKELNSIGSTSMALVGKLFLSRDFSKLVPDQSIIASKSGSKYVAAARTSDGNSVIVYMPSSMTITINMNKVSGSQSKAWWFNPASGQASPIGSYTTTGTQSFSPPFSGDSVLVIDNAALNLDAPGTTVFYQPSILVVPGDTDGDGHVNIYDYNNLMKDFGTTAARSNFDGKGTVDIYDYNTLISNFGR